MPPQETHTPGGAPRCGECQLQTAGNGNPGCEVFITLQPLLRIATGVQQHLADISAPSGEPDQDTNRIQEGIREITEMLLGELSDLATLARDGTILTVADHEEYECPVFSLIQELYLNEERLATLLLAEMQAQARIRFSELGQILFPSIDNPQWDQTTDEVREAFWRGFITRYPEVEEVVEQYLRDGNFDADPGIREHYEKRTTERKLSRDTIALRSYLLRNREEIQHAKFFDKDVLMMIANHKNEWRDIIELIKDYFPYIKFADDQPE